MASWQLQEAKARFSEVVKSSQEEGPQEITVRGKPAAFVISRTDYERLRRRKPGFVEFMRQSPLVGIELDLDRDRTTTRDVDL